MKKYLFLLSRGAGRGKSIRYVQEIRQIFSQAGLEENLQIRMSEHAGHVQELAAEFAAEHADSGIVYSCGGDGSLGEAAQAILGTGCALGVIPLGTGNDFAKSVLPSLNVSAALQASVDPAIRPIDVIRLRFHAEEEREAICVNVMSFGFDTRVLQKTYDFQKKLRLGGMAYYAAVAATVLGGIESFPTRYRLLGPDGEETVFEENSILGALCNGGYYGNGFQPAPMAKVDDGLLTLFRAENMPLARVLPLILQYRRGTHLEHPKVAFHTVVSGSMEGIGGPILGNHDGTIFSAQSVDFEVLPGALPFAFLTF